MSQNINVKSIQDSFRNFITKLQKYASFMFFVAILLIYSFLVLRVSVLSQAEPNKDEVSQQSTVKRLKIDQNSIDRLEQLEDQNISVKSLFDTARDNPFQD